MLKQVDLGLPLMILVVGVVTSLGSAFAFAALRRRLRHQRTLDRQEAQRGTAQRAPRPASEAIDGMRPCPECRSPMVSRTAQKGQHAGQKFWGCSRFPACRGTQPA